MQEITTVGLDLAKNLFHLIGCNAHGKEVKRKIEYSACKPQSEQKWCLNALQSNTYSPEHG